MEGRGPPARPVRPGEPGVEGVGDPASVRRPDRPPLVAGVFREPLWLTALRRNHEQVEPGIRAPGVRGRRGRTPEERDPRPAPRRRREYGGRPDEQSLAGDRLRLPAEPQAHEPAGLPFEPPRPASGDEDHRRAVAQEARREVPPGSPGEFAGRRPRGGQEQARTVAHRHRQHRAPPVRREVEPVRPRESECGPQRQPLVRFDEFRGIRLPARRRHRRRRRCRLRGPGQQDEEETRRRTACRRRPRGHRPEA